MEQRKFKANRTTLTLYQAMMRLLSCSSFDDITVNDICIEAMVSRSTFYSYFTDKYELIVFFLEQERSHLEIVRGKHIQANILAMLLRFQEKANVYQNLLLAQANRELNQMIVSHMQESIAFCLEKVISDPEKLLVQTVFFSTGLAGSVLWWIQQGFPISAEVFAEHLYQPLAVINRP